MTKADSVTLVDNFQKIFETKALSGNIYCVFENPKIGRKENPWI